MALYVKFDCATCENENCTGYCLPTTEKVCDGYKHTDTNADRIRAMTDEELAKWIVSDIIEPTHFITEECEQAWLEWLKEKCEL